MTKLKILLKYAIVFLIIPCLAISGAFVFKEKFYVYVITLTSVFSVALFYCGFEKKKTTSRRLVLCAVMTSLCVIGRFIPFFKPITAISVISAVYMGSEAGFLVGSMSALISNFYFGQGPWTPFQMLAWGIIGFFAGTLSSRLEKSKLALTLYCATGGIVYSLLLDVFTVLSYNGTFSLSLYGAAVITSLPHMALYTISNTVFAIFLSDPFKNKFNRIKLKYGI